MLNEFTPVITRYLNGRMSAAERQDFEARLAAEPALAAELTFYETLHHQHDQNRRERWQALGQQLLDGANPATEARPALTLQVTQRRSYYRLAVAAALALLISAVGFWLYQRSEGTVGERLYAQETSVLDDPGTLGANTGQDGWTKAYQLYREKNYTQARQEVSPLLAQDAYRDRAHLLLGFSWLQENDPEQARAALGQVSPKATAYYWQARFGTALAYLRENKLDQAAVLLRDVGQQTEAPALKTRANTLLEALQQAQ